MDLETILASGLSYFFCAVVATDVALIVVAVVETTACGLSSYCSAAADLEATVAAAVADATTDVSKIIPLKSFCLYRQKLFMLTL